MRKRLLFITFVLVIIFIVASGCGEKSSSTEGNTNTGDLENLSPRTGQLGNVEIEVLWVTPDYVKANGNPAGQVDPEKSLVFFIAMTTHSGDLLGYDLSKMAELSIGGKSLKPVQWRFTKSDAHHPEGVLIFPGNVNMDKGPLTLVIKGLGDDSEVSFNWDAQ